MGKGRCCKGGAEGKWTRKCPDLDVKEGRKGRKEQEGREGKEGRKEGRE